MKIVKTSSKIVRKWSKVVILPGGDTISAHVRHRITDTDRANASRRPEWHKKVIYTIEGKMKGKCSCTCSPQPVRSGDGPNVEHPPLAERGEGDIERLGFAHTTCARRRKRLTTVAPPPHIDNQQKNRRRVIAVMIRLRKPSVITIA
jgi:hypothetical protein